jgi:3-hydroxyisobutyrate dehydrogenase-like beta-hydroxyacid dehydrogenase
MARNLIDAAYEVRGWNRSSLPEYMIAGIQLCQKLEEAARADVCLLMLLDSA